MTCFGRDGKAACHDVGAAYFGRDGKAACHDVGAACFGRDGKAACRDGKAACHNVGAACFNQNCNILPNHVNVVYIAKSILVAADLSG